VWGRVYALLTSSFCILEARPSASDLNRVQETTMSQKAGPSRKSAPSADSSCRDAGFLALYFLLCLALYRFLVCPRYV
jgi:hypothetical protein